MLDILIGLLLLAAGFWGGRKSVRLPAPAAAPGEPELQRLREEKAAFDLLMGYDARQAYGGDQ